MTFVDVEVGSQRVMKVLGQQLGALVPGLLVVQPQGVFEPRRQDLPVLCMAWRQRASGLLARLEYPVAVTAEPTIFSFVPKVAGVHQDNQQENPQTAFLYDPSGDFSHIVVGDRVRNKTQGTSGVVSGVVSGNRVICDGVTFAVNDEYDIHWPIDALTHYTADRKGVVVLDLYARPQLAYGTSSFTLDEIERVLVGSIWTSVREALQEVYVEVVNLERVYDASGIIASGLGADWYDRATIELTVVIGDGLALRKPSVEAVPIPATPKLTNTGAKLGKSGFVEAR